MKTIKIGKRTIGDTHPLYFIADVGANHDGDLQRALNLIEIAKEAGADAAKFQNFAASKIVSKYGFDNLGGQLSHQKNWKKSVFEIYQDASISQDWTAKLKEKCDEVGIDYFTSPYDFDSIDHVDSYVDVYKIGSGDITWLEILAYIAKKNKPVMIATGAATLTDVDRAMTVLQAHTTDIVLMQCNTNYTMDADKYKFVNLNVLKLYAQRYPDAILGLSDHTIGGATVAGAVALGARVFEKHFTDDNARPGPDHPFAMNPTTWRQMVTDANTVYAAMGDGIKRIEPNETQAVVVQQRALRLVRPMQAGETIQPTDLEALRPIPADGLPPYRKTEIVGRKLNKNLPQGTHISLNDIE
jgi:N-acetylneuraminate synthase